MCFDTDDGRWEVCNESRAAQPQCYLFHYLNNESSTVSLMLLLDTNFTFPNTLLFRNWKQHTFMLFCTDFWDFFFIFSALCYESLRCGAVDFCPESSGVCCSQFAAKYLFILWLWLGIWLISNLTLQHIILLSIFPLLNDVRWWRRTQMACP